MEVGSVSDLFNDNQTDYTINGKCSNCGNCCSDILPMTKKEVETIRRYIKKHNIKEQINAPAVLIDALDIICPFRDNKNKKCLIYEVRPAICRGYMCNRTSVEIGLAIPNFFKNELEIVFMRNEFYNSSYDKAYIENYLFITEERRRRSNAKI